MYGLLGNALKSTSISKTVAFLIENIPFYAANTGVINGYYSSMQVIFMLGFGIITFIASNMMLNRRSV